MLENPNVLLLLDYILPDMSGKELVKTLAKRKRRVPFIVITGHGDEKTAVEMMKLGARDSWDYLVKDTDFLALLPQVLRHILEDLTTERKLVETKAELLGSEERYRSLVENVPDIIHTIDRNGNFSSFNEYGLRLLGYREDELIGQHFRTVIYPDDMEMTLELFKQAVSTKKQKPRDLMFRIIAKDRRVIWVSLNASMTFDERGEFLQEQGIARDFTERKQAEKRQSELINELESANNELKDFAHIVSHDLKAPLRAISSLAEWIAADYADMLDAEGKEQLDLLKNRVRRMHRFIDGILQYSRVGRVKEEKEEVNLNTLVTEVIDLIDPPENIEIEVVDALPTIYCEQTKMEQVFQNLLSNVVKYMDKPEGKVTIGCSEARMRTDTGSSASRITARE